LRPAKLTLHPPAACTSRAHARTARVHSVRVPLSPATSLLSLLSAWHDPPHAHKLEVRLALFSRVSLIRVRRALTHVPSSSQGRTGRTSSIVEEGALVQAPQDDQSDDIGVVIRYAFDGEAGETILLKPNHGRFAAVRPPPPPPPLARP